MNNKQRIVWTQGMFLVPQHFQTQDEYFQDSTHFRFASSNYANWGVTALDADAEALPNGQFILIKAHGIMPDGLVFRMPDGDDLPPSRSDIERFFPPTQREMDVYLAIREQRPGGANISLNSGAPKPVEAGESDRSTDTRYVAAPQKIPDLNSGADPKDVQVARKNFQILFGSENRDGFTSLRIAQITRSAAGVYMLKPTHVAPCLDIAHSKYLLGLLQTLVGILSNKSASLSATRREGGRNLADFAPSETPLFWLLQTVNTSLPDFKHIWKVRHGHPEQAYLAMSRLAAALATFSPNFSPNDIPDYDHKDLGACFTTLNTQIRLLIDTIIVEAYITVPLTLGDGGIWTGTVMDRQQFQDSQFFLSIYVPEGMNAGKVIQEAPIVIRAAAVNDVPKLIATAVRGISLTHKPAPPVIRMKLRREYFELNQQGPLWGAFKEACSLGVFVPSEIREPNPELIIIKNKR